jgi:murein L,D-transpeptidase YafK
MRRVRRLVLFLFAVLAALGGAAVVAWAHWPIAPLLEGARIDRVLVLKAERQLLLLDEETVLRRYPISLGGAPQGHKRREGDERTPEGLYRLDARNPRSAFHLSLHVSYPDAEDRRRAARAEVDPGGMIMVHGLPNRLPFLGRLHRLVDWTDGCIAVTNPEMEQIWRAVEDGTPIEIRP